MIKKSSCWKFPVSYISWIHAMNGQDKEFIAGISGVPLLYAAPATTNKYLLYISQTHFSTEKQHSSPTLHRPHATCKARRHRRTPSVVSQTEAARIEVRACAQHDGIRGGTVKRSQALSTRVVLTIVIVLEQKLKRAALMIVLRWKEPKGAEKPGKCASEHCTRRVRV